ncbi:MAG: tRNA1(Val) (adenine(37)-N6)-methyltransferase [Alphaproteobacteria bacterium]
MQDDTIISVLNGAVRLQQIEGGFKTSIDAVLLAASCPAKNGQSILDLGCGVGSAGLSVLHRLPQSTLKGIDIQADHIEIANGNAALNNRQAVFECADIRSYQGALFDHVICNPPFEDAGAHLVSPSDKKAAARGHLQGDINLEDWVKCAFNNLKSGGSLSIIHKAGATQKILQAFGKSFGATEIIPLWPKSGKEAKRVIIRTRKHRKSPAHIHPGLVLHDEDGTYTKAAEMILRQGKGLL